MAWDPPLRPAEVVETRLIASFLDGSFPIGSNLPAERELATLLGVTRPTLREALQRLARDGWVDIHQGRPTRVKDYWRQGNLGVLAAIARHQDRLPPDFVPNLLSVRLALAPAYTRQAIEQSPVQVIRCTRSNLEIEDTPASFAQADWELHHTLTLASGNPVFTLILNGFQDLYLAMAPRYFTLPQARAHSRAFYSDLLQLAQAGDAEASQALTRRVMEESIELWHAASRRPAGDKP